MRGILARALAFAIAIGVVASLGSSREAAAQSGGGNFGLGLIVGEPTGVSGKLYLSRRNAIDGAVGFGFVDERGLHVHADYLWHPLVLTQAPSFDLPLYIGVGGRLVSHSDHMHIGPRGVVGILFAFKTAPIDVFLEFAAGLDLVSGDHKHRGGLTLDLSAGIRYYF